MSRIQKRVAIVVATGFMLVGLDACTPGIQIDNQIPSSGNTASATASNDVLQPLVDSTTRAAVYRGFWGQEPMFKTVLKKDANGCLISDAKEPQLLIVPEETTLTSDGITIKLKEFKFGQEAKFRGTGSTGYGDFPVAIPEGCDYPEERMILVDK